ncbi:MAG: hypothetical protein ACREQM_01390 [Candidatus Dormibacteraceae bacterium]
MAVTRPRTRGSIQTLAGDRASGWQALRLLWRSSRLQTLLVLFWVAMQSILPALVVVALGVVVGLIPPAVSTGLGSTDGHRLLLRCSSPRWSTRSR